MSARYDNVGAVASARRDQSGYLIRRMLQIAVHDNGPLAGSRPQSLYYSGSKPTSPLSSTPVDEPDRPRGFSRDLGDHLRRAIIAVVDKQNFGSIFPQSRVQTGH